MNENHVLDLLRVLRCDVLHVSEVTENCEPWRKYSSRWLILSDVAVSR
jgi:hypothetical protein